MKKALKITGIVLLAIVVVLAGLTIWQWRYVSAVIDGLRMDEEQLGQARVEDAEKSIDSLNQFMDSDIRPMTEEEKAKIQSGELSQTEVMAQIIAEATGITLPDITDIPALDSGIIEDILPPSQGSEGPDAPSNGQGKGETNDKSGGKTSGTSSTENTSSSAPVSSYDQLVANCVSKLYTLQAQYSGQLAGLAGRAKAYYNEQKAANGAAAAKSSAMSMATSEAAALEGSCDAKVEAALGELSAGLKSIGADASIVNELRSAYQREKSNQYKAFVNRYMK